jgi:1-acyl-sn-glycerol-3-phosphate acyltransferase
MAYWVVKAILTPLLRLGFRVRCEGLDVVPGRGPVILASNHRSFIDSLFLPSMVRRRVTFVAKAEYFESWKTAWFFRAVGMIPLKREGGTASERALAAAREVLQGGGVLGIYPEGTRSPDGRLYRGRTGVGWLALASGLPVIPVGMVGTDRVLPPGHSIPTLHRVEIRVGKPLTFESYQDARPAARARRAVTDEVMEAIRALSGQEYVPMYASARKDELSGQANGQHH